MYYNIYSIKKIKMKTKASSVNDAKGLEELQEEALNEGINRYESDTSLAGINSNILLRSMSRNPLATKLQLVLTVAGRFEGSQNFRDYIQRFNGLMVALNTSVKDKLTILGVCLSPEN
jgi:hypothetical protein